MTFPQPGFLRMVSALLMLSGVALAGEKSPTENKSLDETRQEMTDTFHSYELTGDPDYDYAKLMIELDKHAIEMSRWMVEHTENTRLKGLAQTAIGTQEEELDGLQDWLSSYSGARPEDDADESRSAFNAVRDSMDRAFEETNSAQRAYAEAMVWHHEAVFALSKVLEQQSVDAQLRLLATDAARINSREIANFTNWLARTEE